MSQQGRSTRIGRIAAIAGLMSSVACYSQVPVSEAVAPPGEQVHAVLTPYGSVQMVPKLGPNVHELDGQLVGYDTANVTIALATTVGLDGTEQKWSGDRIAFPRSVLDRLTTPRFSARNTVLMGAVTAVGLLVLRGALGGTSSVGGPAAGGPTGAK